MCGPYRRLQNKDQSVTTKPWKTWGWRSFTGIKLNMFIFSWWQLFIVLWTLKYEETKAHGWKIWCSHKKNTRMLEEIPLRKKPISYKWIYRTKYNTCGSLNKQKERQIASSFALWKVVQKERQIANGFAL